MISIEPLLEPISAEKPCGVDPAQSGDLFRLEQSIRPVPGVDGDSDPDWAKTAGAAREILARSKDLRVVVIYALASLRGNEALVEFRDCLRLLREWVERFWDTVFPRLDSEAPEDDPTRANALGTLAPPVGREGHYRFVSLLRDLKLSHSPQLANYSLRDYLRAEGRLPREAADKPVTLVQMEPAFRDPAPAAVSGVRDTHRQLVEILAALQALETSYAAKCGDGPTPVFDSLRETLETMESWVGTFVVPAASESAAPPAPGGSESPAAAAPAPAGIAAVGSAGVSGTPGATDEVLRSTRDVERVLRRVCDYYAEHDRCSPVPLLVERALRLLDKTFLQTVGELTPESLKDLNKLFGVGTGGAEKK